MRAKDLLTELVESAAIKRVATSHVPAPGSIVQALSARERELLGGLKSSDILDARPQPAVLNVQLRRA